MGYATIIQDIDAQIRAAEMGSARRALAPVVDRRVPRQWKAPLANLAWRCSLPLVGLRLLNAVVRPPPKSRVEATPEELLEYSACLTKIGAVEEALKLLVKISPKENPTTLLYQVFARVSRWDYAPTVELLNQYIQEVQGQDYQVVVAKVNLIYAHLFLHAFDRADTLIREVDAYARENNLKLVLGKALELNCQSRIFRGDRAKARESIRQAKEVLGEDSLDGFFVRKLERALDLKMDPNALKPIREEARRRRHWETLRDCDRMEGMFLGNEAALLRVYFGTPYPSYCEQLIRSAFPTSLKVPTSYSWVPQKGPHKKVVDVIEGRVGREQFPKDRLLHQMLRILASDFYRPIRLATLFHHLHPDEFFHPDSSPPRIYDLIARFRQRLADSGVPVKLEERGGEYQLQFSGPCEVVVAPDYASKDQTELERLRGEFGESVFSAGEVARVLDFPLRTSQRFCRAQTEKGHLEREGSGKATRYRFVSKAS